MTPQGNRQIWQVDCPTEKLGRSPQLVSFMENKQPGVGGVLLIKGQITMHALQYILV